MKQSTKSTANDFRFAVNFPSPHREAEIVSPFQSEMKTSWIQAYIAWRVKTGKGRICDRITVTTLQKEFQQIQRTMRLANNFVWENREITVIKKVSLKDR